MFPVLFLMGSQVLIQGLLEASAQRLDIPFFGIIQTFSILGVSC
jgi:hypothetical protein